IPSRSQTAALISTVRAVAAGTGAAPRYGDWAGAPARSAEFSGVQGLIQPDRRAAGKTAMRRTKTLLRRDKRRGGGRARCAARAGCNPGPATASGLDAQREQCDRADTHDQDHQGYRVVIEPMSTLYIHDAPRPGKSHPLLSTPDRGRPMACVSISRG